MENGNAINIQWLPGHKHLPGHEEADHMAKIGATDVTVGSPESHLILQSTSRAYLKRAAAEKKGTESSNWWMQSMKDSQGYLERNTPIFRPEMHRV
jgi:hypothetical protein